MRRYAFLLGLWLLAGGVGTRAGIAQEEVFYRGDCNFSREPVTAVDLSDAAALLRHLLPEGPERFQPPCLDACDCDDNGVLEAADVLCILDYHLRLGSFPPDPGPGIADTGAGGFEETAEGADPTSDTLDCSGDGAVPPLNEDCDNGIDDDEDGLVDQEDPECLRTFACGSRSGSVPGDELLVVSLGSTVDVDLFIRNPDGAMDGFTMALVFSCALSAGEELDIAGSVLETLSPEFVSVLPDNDANDGDGCELVLGVLLDATSPFDGRTLPAGPDFQLMGSVTFTATDDPALCGSIQTIAFQDGISGKGVVPVRNRLSVGGHSRPVADAFPCEVGLVEVPRFYRGDCNYSFVPDGYAVDVADAAAVLSYLFGEGVEGFFPPCLDACDCNDDGQVALDDSICIVKYYFEQGPVPPPPGPGLDFSGPGNPTPTEAGPDPTEDQLDCDVGVLCDA